MLPFSTPTTPQADPAAATDQPPSAGGPSALGAAPDQVPFSPPPQKGIPWLLVGAAVGVVGAGTALTWWMLVRKKSGSEARLDNPTAVQVETKKPGSTPKPKPTEPVFTLDDEPETFTLTEFLDNNEHLSNEDLETIEVMKVGDEHALGGGAWARFVLKRVG